MKLADIGEFEEEVFEIPDFIPEEFMPDLVPTGAPSTPLPER